MVSARFLSSHYYNLRIYDFPEPEKDVFSQVVLFANKRTNPERSKAAYDELVMDAKFEGASIEHVRDREYPIVPVEIQEIMFTGMSIDIEAAVAEAQRNGLWAKTEISDALWPPETARTRPLMPLRRGHLGLLTAAGFMNNLVLTNDDSRIIVKGRTTKEMVQVESTEDADVYREKMVTSIIALDLDSGIIEEVQ